MFEPCQGHVAAEEIAAAALDVPIRLAGPLARREAGWAAYWAFHYALDLPEDIRREAWRSVAFREGGYRV